MRVFRFVQVVAFGSVLAPVSASADPELRPRTESEEAGFGYHPWLEVPKGPIDIDVRALRDGERVAAPVEQPGFWSLDEMAGQASPDDDAPAESGMLPPGWVQLGTVVVPEDVAFGGATVDMEPISAVEMIPGNKYPRKHTLFLNFSGGMLYYGADNSAENRSMLAKQAIYPAYQGGEANALSIIQAVQAKMAPYGIRVLYDFRPSKTVPYTMEMVGGSWTDTNIDSPAGGVAPGTDCGALGQRHVVYTFTGGGGGNTNSVANTIAHEAGHAWGLDHSLNCNSVMSYCASGIATYVNQCSGLCEAQCQGNPAGCRLTHEIFCGEGSNQQNDHAELSWIFGGNEPDIEPPTVEIVEPAGDIEVETGSSVAIRAFVDDDYGGFGWKAMLHKDGALIFDEVDYTKKSVDNDFLVAYRLTNLEDGVYEFTIEAEDHFEHVSSDTVTVVVGPVPAGGSGDGGGEGDDGDDDDSGGDDAASSGETDGGAPDDGVGTGNEGGFDDDGSGCACSASPRDGGTAAPLVLLLAVGLLRRRKAG